MGNILRTVVTWILCLFLSFMILFFLSSSWFSDVKPIKEIFKINEYYYILLPDVRYSAEGIQIGHSTDGKGSYEIISSNCDEIYYSRDTIMYSCTLYSGSQDTSYYIIPIKPERKDGLDNNPIQIKKATFKKNIVRFNKINLPDETR